jgi:hypothetical protein
MPVHRHNCPPAIIDACYAAIDARYMKLVRFIIKVFMKIFFIAKTSCEYTMNYLRAAQSLQALAQIS